MSRLGYTYDDQGIPLTEPPLVRRLPLGVVGLIVDRHHIRNSIQNPGTSFALRAAARVGNNVVTHSREIGNSEHLDLIQLDEDIATSIRLGLVTRREWLDAILWIDCMSDQQAQDYLGIGETKRLGRKLRTLDRGTEQARSSDPEGMGAAGTLRPVPHESGGLQEEVPPANG